jgi:hypothetical protein
VGRSAPADRHPERHLALGIAAEAPERLVGRPHAGDVRERHEHVVRERLVRRAAELPSGRGARAEIADRLDRSLEQEAVHVRVLRFERLQRCDARALPAMDERDGFSGHGFTSMF